jgi:tRNA(Ile)-lysidine synthase
MALLGVLAELGPALGLRVVACGVDHGLRAEAGAELELAQQWAERWSVPFERRSVCVPGNSNLQALAREARYTALADCAQTHGLNYIVTAHHLEDRAETVLLRLLRGAGPEGLCVLPPRLGNRLRPMIHASKAQVRTYLTHHQIPFATDPSNTNDRFLRVRVRLELLPLLHELSPGIVEHLNNLADELGRAPLPQLVDENGEELLLNRSQRAELRKALDSGRKNAEIWLSAGRAIVIDPETMLPRVVSANHQPRQVTQNSTSRATKSSKSH